MHEHRVGASDSLLACDLRILFYFYFKEMNREDTHPPHGSRQA